jgi:hypothetical protein
MVLPDTYQVGAQSLILYPSTYENGPYLVKTNGDSPSEDVVIAITDISLGEVIKAFVRDPTNRVLIGIGDAHF